MVTSFNLNFFFRGPISKYDHILRYWGLGPQPLNLGGWETIQSITAHLACNRPRYHTKLRGLWVQPWLQRGKGPLGRGSCRCLEMPGSMVLGGVRPSG